jgi:hypothetical protein
MSYAAAALSNLHPMMCLSIGRRAPCACSGSTWALMFPFLLRFAYIVDHQPSSANHKNHKHHGTHNEFVNLMDVQGSTSFRSWLQNNILLPEEPNDFIQV